MPVFLESASNCLKYRIATPLQMFTTIVIKYYNNTQEIMYATLSDDDYTNVKKFHYTFFFKVNE